MDSKELRNLQEAYLEVYEAKKPLPVGKMDAKAKELKSKFLKSKPGSAESKKLISRASQITGTRDEKTVNEYVNIYDIILSHLLDEGYAETPEAAQVMMVNMSEEWRESIIENQLNEISQKLATKAFARRATGEFEYDTDPSNYTKSGEYKSDLTKRRIEKKFGKKAGAHAERASHASIFGRKGLGGMPSVS